MIECSPVYCRTWITVAQYELIVVAVLLLAYLSGRWRMSTWTVIVVLVAHTMGSGLGRGSLFPSVSSPQP